jgi:myo-inositol 2-dehydrogenase / D-chiro-inositol 1-dehydrogenase
MKKIPPTVKRRNFIKGMLVAGVAPMFISSRLLGRDAPSNIMRIGVIGAGRMGRNNLTQAMSYSRDTLSRIVAICDVDLNRARRMREEVKARRKEDFGEEVEIPVYQDYRQMLAECQLDGVINSTPDFQHALTAIACARAGIGMYIEKPFTYTVHEGQALIEAVRENNVVVQVGSQHRSMERYHRACWLVRNGAIGKLKEVEVVLPPDRGSADFIPSAVPAHLNYDMWLGPAPFVPYSETRVHSQGTPGVHPRPGWLQVEQYCLGMITGWGAHIFDIARWAIGPEVEQAPYEVVATGEFPDRGVYDVHTNFEGQAKLSNGVLIRSSTGDHMNRFVGENGWISVSRTTLDANDPSIIRTRPSGGVELKTSRNQMLNFLECLRSKEETVAPAIEGHRTNNLCVMHWISIKLGGRKIVWDPVREEIVGDAEASSMLHYTWRHGYSLT